MKFINKIFFLTLFLPVGICWGNQIEIITTTSHISTIAQEIGQSKIKVSTLIPPGICPGHYEIRPGDIKKLHTNGILLYHGWEGFIDDIKSTVSNANAKLFCIDIPGNWLIPDTQIKAAEKISNILSMLDPSNKGVYLKNLASYTRRMLDLDRKIKNFIQCSKLQGIPVISSEILKDFLNYIGFNVIDTFGKDEELTPNNLKHLIDQAKLFNVKIIISNLQSGTNIGETISRITKKPHVVLSNFPGGFQNTETIEKTIMLNLILLKNAVR